MADRCRQRRQKCSPNAGPDTRLTIEVRMQNANLSQEMPQEERSRTIPDTPRRSAELSVVPADIIERAAQRLDWTIAFGMRHNTPHLEGTTNELSQSDPRVRWTSRLRFSRVGLTPLPAISLLCFMSVLAAGAVGAGIFRLRPRAHPQRRLSQRPVRLRRRAKV